MSTHTAVVAAKARGRLETRQVPTVTPSEGEVRVRVEWTASTPLDLHQNDGGLLVNHPQVLGDGAAGTVVEVGPGVKNLKVGDRVFGFTWRGPKEKAHQEFITVPEYLLGKLPANATLQEAVTLPNNFVTVFHAVTKDLGLPLPWPRPADPRPAHADDAILIWGGSSSVGQYAIQILKWYGYNNIIATASAQHHALLQSFGAVQLFDYRTRDVTASILAAAGVGSIPFILDCIGSKSGSLAPLAQIAKSGAKVAVLLPAIVKDASESEAPEYEMDVQKAAAWSDGVDARGVRTHFYLEDAFFEEYLQPVIMPTLLGEGIVKPNKTRIIEGETLLERAQTAIDILRRKEVSGERLVWRVSN
ncbi:zinc-binding dehydrogenase [Phlyctema vagabunda]|uniref:Zinc-binding dehydrogenase n=1 Tax=Phlyctema vagabunda TaxID=108571 RepID=A0ABR4PGC6_9HELO